MALDLVVDQVGLGGGVEGQPRGRDLGGVRAFMLEDPDGLAIELVETP